MRLKKVANAYERLNEDVKYFVANPESNKGLWHKVFNNTNPLHVEIGCGKGRFIINMCKTYPNVNFIAIEKFDSVLIRTLENAIEHNVSNLKLVLFDAIKLQEIFNPKEINTLYLNFSDPWPKTKHAKKRLTNVSFLNVFNNVLDEFGSIIQKTDNRLLFESSLESFSKDDWYLNNISLDLHKTSRFNIQTEYEEKWSKKGPIYTLEAYKNKNLNNLFSFNYELLTNDLPLDVYKETNNEINKEEIETLFDEIVACDNTNKKISIDNVLKYKYYRITKKHNNNVKFFTLMSKNVVSCRRSDLCAVFTCKFKDTNDMISYIESNDLNNSRYKFNKDTLLVTYETIREVFTTKIYIEVKIT